MPTRPLTIEIPEPDKDEECRITCFLYTQCRNNTGFMDVSTKEVNDDRKWVFTHKPGPGCPWYEGGER